jgi:MFS family permease
MSMPPLQSGLAGAALYLGLGVGCMISTMLGRLSVFEFQRLAVLMVACAVALAAVAPNREVLILARFMSGVFHGPFYVFFPVWVDLHAPEGHETRWMGVVGAAAMIAPIINYFILTVFVYRFGFQWRVCYGYLALSLGLCSMILDRIDQKYWYAGAPRTDAAQVFDVFSHSEFLMLAAPPLLVYFTGAGIITFHQQILTAFGVGRTQLPFYFFALCGGPIIGSLLGSVVADFLGGYRERSSARLLVFVSLTGAVVAGTVAVIAAYQPSVTPRSRERTEPASF